MFETKQDYVKWLKSVLDPLKPFYSQGCARLHIGDTGATYPKEVIELEAFARPLWALAPFWKGGGEGFEDIYRKGLKNGSNPEHSEYWGGFCDYDQRFVEMAAIAHGLVFAPDKAWEPLEEEDKQKLASWLNHMNEYQLPECNWYFFRVLVNVALLSLKMPYSEVKMEEALQKIDSYYLGEGWYRDGDSNQKDYYVSFAMHYYGLLYAAAMGEKDRERCERFRKRAELFAKDFIYWFAEDGAALPFGRSLTYRFAQGAFWSAYVFAGLKDIPLGIVKGILSRHLNWWMKQDIFDRDGILTIGYAYPNGNMAERYNAPGSPYWSMKTLLLLALDDRHPFWSVKAKPLPKLMPLKRLTYGDMLLHRCNKEVIAYPAGSCQMPGHGHWPEKYSKFAYSTRFGFSVARSQLSLCENAPDSMLAFVIDGSDAVFVRKKSAAYQVMEDRVVSEWQPFPGICVTTVIIPTKTGHKRIHEVESEWDCTAYDCGFAVEKFTNGYVESACGQESSVSYEKQGCSLKGEGPEAAGILLSADPNTNILYRNSTIPAISYRIQKGKRLHLETLVETVVSKT